MVIKYKRDFIPTHPSNYIIYGGNRSARVRKLNLEYTKDKQIQTYLYAEIKVMNKTNHTYYKKQQVTIQFKASNKTKLRGSRQLCPVIPSYHSALFLVAAPISDTEFQDTSSKFTLIFPQRPPAKSLSKIES